MKTSKRNILTGSLIAGAFVVTGGISASASNLINFNELGSGSQIRANLMDHSLRNVNAKTLELNCGEKAKADTAAKKSDSKMKDAKCGEGKCGEGKCGEGKCGADKKDAKKADVSKDEKKAEGKAKDAKCGEGKCGVN